VPAAVTNFQRVTPITLTIIIIIIVIMMELSPVRFLLRGLRTFFWDVLPRALLTRRFDDVGSKHLWNVSKHLSDYTTRHPRSNLRTCRRQNLKRHLDPYLFLLKFSGVFCPSVMK
jgi:hypothetical protein